MPEGDDPAFPVHDAQTLGDLGEWRLIERLRRTLRSPGAEVLLGIGDDAAAVRWPGQTLLLTTDTLVEDVHFRRATATFQEIGAKALAVNLSDIAAMGGEPRYALLALALPAAMRVAEVDAVLVGLDAMATAHGVTVIGGDTCAAPDRLVLNITLVGAVEGAPLSRRGARPGDAVLVTGTLGAAAAGLAVIEGDGPALPAQLTDDAKRAHRRPVPRVAEGRLIRASGVATAMIDLSDGLATDLGHIAAESGVGAVVWSEALPIAETTRGVARALGVDPLVWAVSGGEDYELLFTAQGTHAADLATRIAAETGTPATVIGRVEPAASGVRFLDRAGRPLAMRPGFDHFAR